VGNISLSLDGRVTGPGGEHDMGWIGPHALTGESRSHMLKVTSLLEAGELDRLSITLCPELVGTGARFFGDGAGGLVLVPDRGDTDQQRGALPALRPDPARGRPVTPDAAGATPVPPGRVSIFRGLVRDLSEAGDVER
jgi:hypothetical protein